MYSYRYVYVFLLLCMFFLFCSVNSVSFVVLCTVCVYMCTVLLPLAVNPIAVNKYVHIISSGRQDMEGPNRLQHLTLILPRSRTGTVWFYSSTSNKRAARPKLYTKSLTRDLKHMYSRLTLVRISINL